MGEDASLYERDFVEWTEEQAARLRAAAGTHPNLHLDWENLAEEIESLGRSDARELRSRLTTIVEHLLKIQYSPAQEPRAGWATTVLRERVEAEGVMEQSPSLRARLDRLLPLAIRDAAKIVVTDLTRRGEIGAAEARQLAATQLMADQVLGDWLPD